MLWGRAFASVCRATSLAKNSHRRSIKMSPTSAAVRDRRALLFHTGRHIVVDGARLRCAEAHMHSSTAIGMQILAEILAITLSSPCRKDMKKPAQGGLRYLVVGSYATHVYGHSRAGASCYFSRRKKLYSTCRREIRLCLARLPSARISACRRWDYNQVPNWQIQPNSAGHLAYGWLTMR